MGKLEAWIGLLAVGVAAAAFFLVTGDVYYLADFGFVRIHAFSIFTGVAVSIVHFSLIKSCLRMRILGTLYLAVLITHSSSLIWDGFSQMVRGRGFSPIPPVALVIVLTLLWDFQRSTKAFNLSLKSFYMCAFYTCMEAWSLAMLSLNGFWDVVTLNDMGFLSIDPNRSPYWLQMRVASMLKFIPFLIGKGGGENE